MPLIFKIIRIYQLLARVSTLGFSCIKCRQSQKRSCQQEVCTSSEMDNDCDAHVLCWEDALDVFLFSWDNNSFLIGV